MQRPAPHPQRELSQGIDARGRRQRRRSGPEAQADAPEAVQAAEQRAAEARLT